MVGDNFTTEFHAGLHSVDRSYSGCPAHRASKPQTVAGLDFSGDHAPTNQSQGEANELERRLMYQQSLIYAEDMAKIYEQEKQRRKALEKINAELTSEVRARRRAEDALLEAHRNLEIKVRERTRALTDANKRLEDEIARREHSEERIRCSLKEKEILLAEIHHRVKNNLQIISSLLALQADLVSDWAARDVLEDSRNRIRSIALIHEHIYRSRDLSRIDFHEYLRSLASNLLKNHSDTRIEISVDTDESPVYMGMDKALPCSLIINELVTNCMKHAFPPHAEGEIRIVFSSTEDDGFLLSVTDNGKGFPDNLDFRSTKSLGLQLVVNLAEIQLQGSIELLTGEGTEFRILFPEERTARKG